VDFVEVTARFGTGGEERGPFHRSDCRYLPVILMGAPMKPATLLARAALDSGRASAEPETVTIGAPRLGGDGLRGIGCYAGLDMIGDHHRAVGGDGLRVPAGSCPTICPQVLWIVWRSLPDLGVGGECLSPPCGNKWTASIA